MATQTEAFARTLIDAQLKDQHWNISDGTSVRYEYTLPNGDRADYMLCSREGRGLAIMESGITISGINQAAMNQIPVLMPPVPLQDSFVARVAEVRSIQSQQSTATAKAQATSDALLARCFAPTVAIEGGSSD